MSYYWLTYVLNLYTVKTGTCAQSTRAGEQQYKVLKKLFVLQGKLKQSIAWCYLIPYNMLEMHKSIIGGKGKKIT